MRANLAPLDNVGDGKFDFPANLEGAKLAAPISRARGSTRRELAGADLSRSNLDHADLSEADLDGANFSDVTADTASFDRCRPQRGARRSEDSRARAAPLTLSADSDF